jgi:hypothetical protein
LCVFGEAAGSFTRGRIALIPTRITKGELYKKKKKFSLIDNSYTTNIEASPLKENINNSTGLLSISFLDEKKSAKEEGR